MHVYIYKFQTVHNYSLLQIINSLQADDLNEVSIHQRICLESEEDSTNTDGAVNALKETPRTGTYYYSIVPYSW